MLMAAGGSPFVDGPDSRGFFGLAALEAPLTCIATCIMYSVSTCLSPRISLGDWMMMMMTYRLHHPILDDDDDVDDDVTTIQRTERTTRANNDVHIRLSLARGTI